MRIFNLSLVFLTGLFATAAIAEEASNNQCAQLLNYEVRTLNESNKVHLCETYKNQVLLVVNTASKCGYTPQYEGLEKLYSNLKDQGFAVLGFPSNDFGGQEPGSEAKVQQFCRLTYGVEFPMFEKTLVKKGAASPFYTALEKASGEAPRWNFHKYLIGRDGKLIATYPSNVTPNDKALLADIVTAIAKE
ncbi:MAG: glutathione peroxidase [Ghiorsea sp.]